MRIRGAKTELQEAGLETDGMVESTAKLREEIMALSGVDIMEANGQTFKSTYAIMDELADKWQDLSDIQQATVTELIAGKRQGNIVSSLMNNFDIAEKALETSLNSAGSAMREHEKWQQSLEAQTLKLKASWQGLSQSFLSSDFLKVALNGVVGLVDGLTKLIDTFGTIPTLTSTFAAGFSLFKNGGIFKTFNTSLDTFTSKIGIANKSFDELANAFNSGKTGTGFKGFISGLKSVGDSLTNTLSNTDLSAIESYNKLLDSGVDGQTAFAQSMKGTSSAAQNLVIGANGSKVAISGMTAATNASKAALIGAKVAAIAFNAALTMGISLLITWAVQGISRLINAKEELAEKVEEVTSKYKEQHEELLKLKGDYDTSNEDSMISKYAKLSKGVDDLGRNVSLTADEYTEYQSIVNGIAEQIPSLVTGYDSQGNAILSCKGNVEELTKAYEKLIKAQNDLVLKGENASNIVKDFKNAMKDAEKSDLSDTETTTHTVDALEKMLNGSFSQDEISTLLNNLRDSKQQYGLRTQIVNALEEKGLENDLHWYSLDSAYDEFIADAIEKHPDVVREIINDFNNNLESEADGVKSQAAAVLSNAFDISSSEYSGIGEEMQNLAYQIVNSFDAEKFNDIIGDGTNENAVEDYINGILDIFKKLEETGDSKELEAAFNLKTQFNSGDISYGDYVNGLRNVEEFINDIDGLDKDVKKQIKLALNTEETIKNYDALKNRLTSDEYEIKLTTDEAEAFLNDLTASEYAVAVDLMVNGDVDLSKFNIDSLREYIEKQARINEALNFTIGITVEAENIEALNTALAESVSAVGLSAESIGVLKSRYSELESQGYDLSSMFEETANGIHLNRAAVSELEEAYASQKLSEVDENLGVLKDRYDELTVEINNASDASERASLYREQQAIVQKINDLSTLASQYQGLTSAYNQWLSAEEAGQERDMYEKIIEGFKNVGDEIKRGWMDDGTIKFLELLTGKTDLASKSGKELKEIYDGLGNTIGNSGYSIRDFFTVDEDGNSTNGGVYNFLETVESFESKLGDVIKRNSDGNIIGFDFEVAGGDEAIAEALGISEELVQIMVRAADDAGFVVTLEGTYTQLADLKTEAESARDALISLKKDGLASLQDTDVNFDFNATGDDLVAEQEKAIKLLDKFRKEDGTIDLSITGAQEALDIAEYLTIKIDDLTEPKYMQIDVSTLEEDLQEPIEKMKEFERLSKEKHLLILSGDTTKLAETESKMDDIAQYLDEIDDTEVQAKLGITGLTKEEIAEKLEKGEIELDAELNLDVQMSDDLKDIKLLMMGQLGIVDENEIKLKVAYDIDDSTVDELAPEQQKVVLEYIVKNEAEFNKYTEAEKEAVVKLVADGVDLEKYKPEDKEAIVNYIANGEETDGWTPEAKEAFVKYLVDGGDPDAFDPENKESWVVYHADTTEPDSYKKDDEKATVIFDADTTEPENYTPTDPEATVVFDKDTKAIDNWIPIVNGIAKFTLSMIVPQKIRNALSKIGISIANGTANANGTAFANGTIESGKAFKRGDWRTKKTEVALTGELGREIVVTPDNHWYTVGDTGAEFATIPRGSIVFNHKQTEELLSNGKVTSGGGRAKALVGGTAFAEGTAFSKGSGGIGKVIHSIAIDGTSGVTKTTTKTTTTSTTTPNGGSKSTKSGLDDVGGKSITSSSSGSGSSDKEFEETFDWIETKISRLERAIDKLDSVANATYKSWTERNEALVKQIEKVQEEIEIQEEAYNRYMQEANNVELSSEWVKKIQDGTIDIETITDEALAEKIKQYQEWYNKAIDCQDAIEELKQTEAELYQQRFENISAQYDGILGVIEHEKNMIEEKIKQEELKGHVVSGEYYEALMENERKRIEQLEKQKADMLAELENAMESGTIEEGSEAWYELCAAIDDTTLAIEQSNTALLEYEKTIEELEWEAFDKLQEKISDVNDEADYMIELLSHRDMYDDNGNITSDGQAVMGLHRQKYDTYMRQADEYAKEIERLNAEIEKEPLNQDLIDRRDELIKLQRESILAAEDEKEAIKDLVEEGHNKELDALREKIDKRKEALRAEKELYDYNKKVKEQTKEIASLEKQMAAYANDDSEEAKAKIQQIKVKLEEAKENLKETQYDKYISDQEEMLDSMYEQYEETLNTRFDNTDALISDVTAEVNANASTISTTLTEAAGSVGYELSETMQTIWDTSTTSITNVVADYGDNFLTAQTTTNHALDIINANLQNMITQLNTIANMNVKAASTSSAVNSGEAKTTNSGKSSGQKTSSTTTYNAQSIKVGGKINATGAQIYDYAGDTSGESQYYKNDPIYTVLGEKNGYLKVRHHKLTSGVTGWFRKSDVKAYATGKKGFLDDEIAWTQEEGQEYIIRPSDGAILTPVAKGDSVLSASATNNVWEMANAPAEFIRDNLRLGTASVPDISSAYSTFTQHLDEVVFNLPNVKNYDELLAAMQKDKNFERLIESMSIGKLTGTSSLHKGKSIR